MERRHDSRLHDFAVLMLNFLRFMSTKPLLFGAWIWPLVQRQHCRMVLSFLFFMFHLSLILYPPHAPHKALPMGSSALQFAFTGDSTSPFNMFLSDKGTLSIRFPFSTPTLKSLDHTDNNVIHLHNGVAYSVFAGVYGRAGTIAAPISPPTSLTETAFMTSVRSLLVVPDTSGRTLL